MKYSIFSDTKKADDCKKQIQVVLNANKGGYSGPPWIYVCVYTAWNTTFVLPMPDKMFLKGIEQESVVNTLLPTLYVVDKLPVQPIKLPMEP